MKIPERISLVAFIFWSLLGFYWGYASYRLLVLIDGLNASSFWHANPLLWIAGIFAVINLLFSVNLRRRRKSGNPMRFGIWVSLMVALFPAICYVIFVLIANRFFWNFVTPYLK